MNTDAPLLDWLLQKFPDTPKKRAKEWIQAGRVTVNGTVIRQPHHRLADPQDGLQLLDRQTTTLNCGPTGLPIHELLKLVYLDSSLAIVNKAAGLLSVPAPTEELSALEILTRQMRLLPPAYRQLKPDIVHRIDFYTSGLFCMAMNPTARADLIKQVSAHTMQREYIAFVEGRPPRRTGTWRHWLKLSPDETEQTIVPAGTEGAKEAITHYEVELEFPRAGICKLRLRLETGRRHQIRIQAARSGVPLVGDSKYNTRYRGRFPRQALHAERLSLTHPEHHRLLTWTAPLPEDMRQLENALQSNRPV